MLIFGTLLRTVDCVDAGMPAISDPRADLVTKAIEESIAGFHYQANRR